MLGENGDKDKENEMNLTSIHEDEELHEIIWFDSGNCRTIDTLNEDDDDIGEENLSWNILVLCVLYLLFCDLVVIFCESLELLVWLILVSILCDLVVVFCESMKLILFFYDSNRLFSCFPFMLFYFYFLYIYLFINYKMRIAYA